MLPRTLSFPIAALALAACTKTTPYPVVDVHVHVEASSASFTADRLVEIMDDEKISHMVIMFAPSGVAMDTVQDPRDTLLASVHASKFKFMYGGNELQPILHATGRGGGPLTVDAYYPNGTDLGNAENEIANFNAMASDPAYWEAEFKTRAQAAADSGNYVGFGELAPLHYSQRRGHPYIVYPANHALLKWLAALAGTKNMVLDIHVEATQEKMLEFSDLLESSPGTKIVWDHAGWSTTGDASAAKLTEMMARHSNLYLSLKFRNPQDKNFQKASPFDVNGKLKDEWAKLLKDYSTRIMIGSDSKYWSSDDEDPATEVAYVQTLLSQSMLQLPADTASAIANVTAKGIFGL